MRVISYVYPGLGAFFAEEWTRAFREPDGGGGTG